MNKHIQPNSLARFALLAALGLLTACTGEFWNEGFWNKDAGAEANGQVATSEPVPLTPGVKPAVVTEEQVARAQTLLRGLGFDPGPVDGKAGSRTTAAVKAYQAGAGLEADGLLSQGLIERLEAEAQAGQVTKAQQRLNALGYGPGPADGRVGPRTEAAIKAFQTANGLPSNGRVTPGLLATLDAAQAERAGSGGAAVEAAETAEAAEAAEAAAGTETGAGEAATAAAAAVAAGAAATASAADQAAESAAETAAETAESASEAAQDAAAPAASEAAQVAALAPARDALAPGDRVLLGYLGTKDQPVELQIGQDGRLALPQSGSVQAAGLGLSELRDRVTVKLIEAYMGSVDVKVAAAEAAAEGDAVVAAGDRLLVSLSGDRSAEEIQVGADGRLGLPDAGTVQAAGLDHAELEEEISVKLLESFMDKLDVRLERAD